ncbi:hypothetical protein [Microvirga makkahensis]|uniref:Uncharacterized protein n=1 Tax=Microvirga makkahensis TaxID=1128670 RepID=A0A7X3MVP0_9HYPH|nr:hypothetical protein [Microvirga makkahensis]MXQ13918.1 hypothetical protein [Microvirga makkahensis]
MLSRLDEKTEGAIIPVMWRMHVDDLAGHLLERGGWQPLNLPAITEADVLDETRQNLGAYDFAPQYQQRSVAVDGGLIKWSWFERFKVAPAREPEDQIVQNWGAASTAGELNEYSV